MALTEKELLELKADVEKAKTRVSELKGQQTTLMKQLKDEFDCATIEEAEAKMEEYTKVIHILEKKIKKGVEEVEQMLA